MANKTLSILLITVGMLLSGVVESMLPKMLGVGVPILLALALAIAARPIAILSILYAIIAGAIEDAVSSLPLFVSVSFFVVAAGLVRWTRFSHIILIAAYPCYQLWLLMWYGNLLGDIWVRVLIAVPMGAMSVFLVWRLLTFIEEKAGISEEA